MAHDIFISYNSGDKAVADAACAIIESEGLRCWIAPRNILPGTEWGEAIIWGVNNSRILVLIFSQGANDSAQVRREVDRAVHAGIPVVPVRIQAVKPTRTMEHLLSTVHWMDALTPPLEAHFRILAGDLSTLLKMNLADVGADRRFVVRTTSDGRVSHARNRFKVAAILAICTAISLSIAYAWTLIHDQGLSHATPTAETVRPPSDGIIIQPDQQRPPSGATPSSPPSTGSIAQITASGYRVSMGLGVRVLVVEHVDARLNNDESPNTIGVSSGLSGQIADVDLLHDKRLVALDHAVGIYGNRFWIPLDALRPQFTTEQK